VLAQALHLGGGVSGGVAAVVAVLAAFALRLLAIWRHWRAPRPLWRGDRRVRGDRGPRDGP
jgi:uncharacterized membrane protein YeiH